MSTKNKASIGQEGIYDARQLGIQYAFIPFYVWYSFIKTVVFAFVIASMASYYGYYARGGALEVGKASTKAVVNSSIVILLLDVVLTNLMLN